ncbi:MAG: hypothetical protein GY805_39935 [Chloroflexi bacterium]|nr:hypothetical protein [Chloroflexota bacterium]
MTTFTLFIWLAALSMFVWVSNILFPYLWEVARRGYDYGIIRLAAFLFIWLIIVFGITSALFSDVFGISFGNDSLTKAAFWWIPVLVDGKSPIIGVTRTRIMFVAGLVALGTCSLFALAYNYFRGKRLYYHYYPRGNSVLSFGSTSSFVMQGIGLLASILGIISFYLDYF